MTGVAVCDSACITALCEIDRLELLVDSYARVLIPAEVREELRNHPVDRFEVRSPTDLEWVLRHPTRVHRAEAAVIALAREIPEAEVVLDDYKARQLAMSVGLKLIGTIGLILRAKQEGRIQRVAPVLKELRASGFHISPALLNQALSLAGEG
jgi:uncharacterized protein